MEVYRRGRDIAPLILNLCTRGDRSTKRPVRINLGTH